MSSKRAGLIVAGVGVMIGLVFVLADVLRLSPDVGRDFGTLQIVGVSVGALILVGGIVFSLEPHKSVAYTRLNERLSQSERWATVVERLHSVVLSLNVLYALIWLYLFVLTVLYLRITPALWFTATKLALIGFLVIFFGWVALFTGRRANLNLLLITTGVLVIGQVALNPERKAQFPAGSTRYPAPYTMFVGQPGKFDHNDLGYRGHLPPDEKGDEYRVFILGGSAVYVADFVPQLERLAHEDGFSEVAVYNWGVVSGVSGMEITTILHRVIDYQPDLVILYNGGNDVTVPYFWDPRPGYPFNFVVYEKAVGILQYRNLPALAPTILAQSEVIRILFRPELEQSLASLARVRAEAGYGTQEWEEQVVDGYLSNMDRACRLAEAFDFRLAVFLQPLAEGQFSPDYQQYIDRQYDQIIAGYDELAEQYSADGRCYFIDASDVCDEVGCQFEDYIHVFSWYNKDIARYLYGHLTGRDLIR
jgi:hypothetical protein